MLKQLKRSLHICIAFAIILTAVPLHMMINTQAATQEKFVDVISFQGDIGYYAQGGHVFKYDIATNATQKVEFPEGILIQNVVSVAYDGTILYLVSDDMTVRAYDITKNVIKWENAQMKLAGNSLGSPILLENGALYVGLTTAKASIINQLQTSDGALLKSSKGSSRIVDGSLPYVSDKKVVFSSKDMALVSPDSERFVKLYDETYTTSVYDSAHKQVFAIGEDKALYTSLMDDKTTYSTLYKTTQSFLGKQSKATIVEDTPLIFTIEENHVMLYLFNGVNFVKQETALTTSSIQNIAFAKGKVYIVDAENKVQSASYALPVKQNMEAQAAQIQQDILKLYDAISNDIKNLTLEKKAEVDSLSTRFQALTLNQQSQVLASSILSELVTKTTILQKNVDDINMEIDKLSSPEEFKKADKEQALAIEVKYKALKTYDKTLIDQKLLRILDKLKAYEVEDEIATLPSYANITITDLSRVQEIAQKYDILTQEWKKDVSNYTTLQRLENRIYELMSSNTLGDAYWSNFGGNKTSSATINTKTPYSTEDIQVNFKALGNYQESIVVDNHIYTIRDKNYLSILDNKGNVIAETKLYNKIGFFSRLAYGDGKIYVALSDHIQAFDAKTLRPLWLSKVGNQFISTITYHNGYIYSGMTTGGGGDKGKTNGYFFAINVKDEDINNTFEEKDFTWTCGETKNTGYYWAGAAIVGDSVVFAGDSGEVISHHLTQDIVFDRYSLGDTKVRANVSYIEEEKAILVGTQDSHTLFKIKMNDDGSFKKENIQSVNVEGEITGGISYYNARAYVPSGGMYAKGFSVVETEQMKLAYRNIEVGTQSYPLISTAYATPSNYNDVKVYVIDYKTGDLLMMSDAQGQTTAKMDVLSKGYGTYNSGSITPDAYGNLYVFATSSSGGGAMYGVQSKDAKFNITDMENTITSFPSEFTYRDKKAFQLMLNTYLNMSEGEQRQVNNSEVLFEYEKKMQAITDAKLMRIQNAIDTLPYHITVEHQDSIRTARIEYGELLESDQLRIQNYEKLKIADEQLQVLLNGFEQLRKDIDAIELAKLTLMDQVSINTLLARYDKLSEQERVYITNYDKLQEAQIILKRLADSLKIPAVNEQVDKIIQIESLSLENEKEIMSLYKTIMSLDETVRTQIKGYDAFLVDYSNIVQQRKLVDDVNNSIWNAIQPLNIQMRDRDTIIELYTRYLQLPEQNKVFITYVEDLQYAKIVIDKMDRGYLAQEVFKKIKMANTSYTFESSSQGRILEYTFRGKDITNPSDFAFHMTSESIDKGAIDSLVKNAQIISFAHEGNFPGKATIKMETNLIDGTYHLYYYNPIKKSAELVQDIDVINKMTTFELTHASTYFISKDSVKPLQQAQLLLPTDVNTGDQTSSLWLWMFICMSIGTLVLLKTKKKI